MNLTLARHLLRIAARRPADRSGFTPAFPSADRLASGGDEHTSSGRRRTPFAATPVSAPTARRVLIVFAFALVGQLALSASSALADTCPNESLREEQHSTYLPDCRAYEKVSPADKNGGDVVGVPQRTRSAADGNAVQFTSLVGFGDVQGSGISFDYIGERTATPGTDGWLTHAITPGNLESLPFIDQALATGFDATYTGEMSSDLSAGVFRTFTPLLPGSPDTEGVMNLYLRTDLRTSGAGSYRQLTICPACTEPLTGRPNDQPEFSGASADYRRVFFESTQNLTEDAQSLGTEDKLYEWHEGSLSLVGQVPSSGGECGSTGPACVPAPSSEAGSGTLFNSSKTVASGNYVRGAISQDGSRVYFTVRSPEGAGLGNIFLRSANGSAAASTVQVNLPEHGATPPSREDARFWGATPNGSRVLFTTKRNLIPADTGNENLTDLYMWDAEVPAGERLTLISQPDPGGAADLKGAIGISDDGAYVYFISIDQLIPGNLPPANGAALAYVWHEGTIHEVAEVSNQDIDALVADAEWRDTPKSSRVSPGGTHLVFFSRSAGSGGPFALSHDSSADACDDPGGCQEVYAYDATANGDEGELVCISCTKPDSPAATDATFLIRSGRGLAGLTSHLNHPLSADGRLVFFSTGERLVPEDTDKAYDVYQYDTQTEEVNLVSSGTDSDGSFFMDASRDGHNVFFITRQSLLGWDLDKAVDLYDARIDGGFPEPEPVPASCAGTETCHGAAPQPPPGQAAATSNFAGPGNSRAKHKRKHHHRRRHHHRANHKGGGKR